ncbi:hypothetical protein Csa_010853 [Cucumis sativus]|uniref:Uncharacterized protein n=1 Tax=Cucumis sativus TaxID=3659 RepID=A0A0A0L408_CUCSA|nr:hypothetical protein Csa_010853 [Cucumis sativus]
MSPTNLTLTYSFGQTSSDRSGAEWQSTGSERRGLKDCTAGLGSANVGRAGRKHPRAAAEEHGLGVGCVVEGGE